MMHPVGSSHADLFVVQVARLVYDQPGDLNLAFERCKALKVFFLK
jgi:hypothetical protein